MLKPPSVAIHFGSGKVSESNTIVPARYVRVGGFCPSDGYYTFTPNTSDCFRGDWHTLAEDHTPGDVNGNMLLVNSSPRTGIFLKTTVDKLNISTTYEFSVWIMNVCRITEKCPFPLLPEISIHLQTPEGKNVAQLNVGEVTRYKTPTWTQFQFLFTTPASPMPLNLIMVNGNPGGCGNDFALDDITFRECVPPPPPTVVARQKTSVVAKKQPAPVKPVTKKNIAAPAKKPASTAVAKAAPKPAPKPAIAPAKKPVSKPVAKSPVKPEPKHLDRVGQNLEIAKPKIDSAKPQVKQRTLVLPPAPAVLRSRTNALVKQIETEAGDIRIDLYDNGEIDGDTVSIYHNNRLLASRARLSQKPITFHIVVNENIPHHELVMVAENLGSIPPNTSLMIVTAGNQRHEVFISSTKQKNAKVVLDLVEP